MADELKSERVVVMMEPSELSDVDDWSFANRVRSRGEAIRRLIRLGLAASSRPRAKAPAEKAPRSGTATKRGK